jgi:hypothetical protein
MSTVGTVKLTGHYRVPKRLADARYWPPFGSDLICCLLVVFAGGPIKSLEQAHILNLATKRVLRQINYCRKFLREAIKAI